MKIVKNHHNVHRLLRRKRLHPLLLGSSEKGVAMVGRNPGLQGLGESKCCQ